MSYSAFTKHVIYPLYQLFAGRDTLRNFKELEKTQWLDTSEIQKIQWKKLKSLLAYAYTTVPYYNRVFKKLKITPKDITTPTTFRKFPLLDKKAITGNIRDIVSLKYRRRDLIPNSTGGSTGVNLDFFLDRKKTGFVNAIVLRNDRWAGLEKGDKNARLWGSPFDISLQDNLRTKIHHKLFRILFLSSYDLSEENMVVYAERLLRFRPKVIVGYPSPLYHFAAFLEENEIRDIQPKSVISSAEVLYDYQRSLIESVFQCRVFNRYGCREFSTVAQECSKHLGMHINAEHLYVECLKEDGAPAAPGEEGELVITNLDNYGMPFVRYRIGDVGRLSEKTCICGRGLPMLETVTGRTFDIVVGTNGRAVGGTFWTLLLRTAIKGIKQFQVVQESMREIAIKVVPYESFEERQVRLLTNRVREYLGKDMNVSLQVVDKIPPSKSGKSRFVISKVATS